MRCALWSTRVRRAGRAKALQIQELAALVVVGRKGDLKRKGGV